MRKKIAWFLSLGFALLPLFMGCGIFDPAMRDSEGYFVRHFECCGPRAIEKALAEYYQREGVVFVKGMTAKEISKAIQDEGQALKKFLSMFDKEIVCVTWSWEMKKAVEKYGFELITIDDFKKLNPEKDIAFVLVRGKFFSRQWHWMCYPIEENITKFFGENTKIDIIYLLKRVKK